MRYRHTMIRVSDLEQSLHFYCDLLGMVETRRMDRPEQKYTLVFLAANEDVVRAKDDRSCEIELTYNYDPETFGTARNFGHLAYEVENVYEIAERLMKAGVTINRPPREGGTMFVRSPDGISIELHQKPPKLAAKEPWASMPNVGSW